MHYYNTHKWDEYIYMALSVLIYIPETSMPAASWAVRDIPTCQCTDVLQFLWTANGNSWPDIDGGQTAGHKDISGPGMSFAARGQLWKFAMIIQTLFDTGHIDQVLVIFCIENYSVLYRNINSILTFQNLAYQQ